MLLGFKKRFADWVEEGTKTHTIRAKRAIRPRAGEVCHCYTGLRQKGARLLGRWLCIRVQDITIRRVAGLGLVIHIDGTLLDGAEARELAWRDGFRGRGRAGALQEMADYWADVHGDELFKGDMIHWDHRQPMAMPAKRRQKAA